MKKAVRKKNNKEYINVCFFFGGGGGSFTNPLPPILHPAVGTTTVKLKRLSGSRRQQRESTIFIFRATKTHASSPSYPRLGAIVSQQMLCSRRSMM